MTNHNARTEHSSAERSGAGDSGAGASGAVQVGPDVARDVVTAAKPAVLFLADSASNQQMRACATALEALLPGVPIRVVALDDEAVTSLRQHQLEQALLGFRIKPPRQLAIEHAVRRYQAATSDDDHQSEREDEDR